MKRQYPLLAICCLTVACSTRPNEASNLTVAGNGGQPALHAVQDKELRQLMDRMNGLMLERFMTEQEMDIERSRFSEQIIAASKTLGDTANALVSKLPKLGLSLKEQNAFRALAQKLGQQANNLQKQTENHNFHAMSATLHDMTSTCMACHTLFRKI